MRIHSLLFLALIVSGALCAQETVIHLTTPEAQSIVEANFQKEQHWWSTYNLGMQQLTIALAAICLLFNIRTLAFVFLIAYAIFGFKTPYYIPTAFKTVFDTAIVVLSALGILTRLIWMGRKLKEAPPQAPN